jgi:hypothetical protein
MLYCEKCSRLLDEDTNVCPYCGNILEAAAFEEARPAPRVHASATLKDLNDRIEQRKTSVQYPGASLDDGRMQSIIHDFEVRNEAVFTGSKAPSVYGASPMRPASPARALPEDEKVGVGFKVSMIILSIFLTIPSLIIGIILLAKKGKSHQSTAIAMIVTSSIFTIVWVAGYLMLFALAS